MTRCVSSFIERGALCAVVDQLLPSLSRNCRDRGRGTTITKVDFVYLLIHSPREGARRIQRTGWHFVIGSAPDWPVVIDDDPAVAARHLELVLRVERVKVTRCEGDVLVNGEPVASSAFVGFRDLIEIGATTIQLWPDWSRHAPAEWSNVPPPHAWRERLAESPAEHDLLLELRQRPGDVPTRTVYADWLLSHGRLAMADEVSGRVADPHALLRESTSQWRALASRLPIIDCNVLGCPRTWDALAATENECARSCGACGRVVCFCSNPREITGCIARAEPFVPDLEVAARTAYAARLDAALHEALDARWRLQRWHDPDRYGYDAAWDVTARRSADVETDGYWLCLEGTTLHLNYEGGIAELRLVGLDGHTIVTWLRHAFDTLPVRVRPLQRPLR
jgi:uncharacterized protein (TIGR02996 family)